MGSLSMLSILGPVQNFTAKIRRKSFSYCHLHSLHNFYYTLDPLYQLFTSNSSTRMAKKQAWHCHTFINDQANAEIQLEFQDESSVDEVFKYPKSLPQIPKLLKITVHQQ